MKFGVVALCLAVVLATGECKKKAKVSTTPANTDYNWDLIDPNSPYTMESLRAALGDPFYQVKILSGLQTGMPGSTTYVMEYEMELLPPSTCFIHFQEMITSPPFKYTVYSDNCATEQDWPSNRKAHTKKQV